MNIYLKHLNTSEVEISAPSNVSLELCLFKLPTDGGIKLFICLNGFGTSNNIHLIQINVPRSACILISVMVHRQVSKMDQLVTIQHVAINTHRRGFTTQHTIPINNGPTAICHYSEDRCFIKH